MTYATFSESFARWLVEELDQRLPEYAEQLKIHIAGCPNACGQHWIADIGIEGKKIRVGDYMVDAYYFCVGGALGDHAAIARPVGYRCAASEVPSAIERLLRAFEGGRFAQENLRQFLRRHSDDEIRSLLAGEQIVAEARDPSPGRVCARCGGVREFTQLETWIDQHGCVTASGAICPILRQKILRLCMWYIFSELWACLRWRSCQTKP